MADRAVQIAQGSGANVIDNLSTPDAVQVKLKVRFAEVNRTALKIVQLPDRHQEHPAA